jgi:hypothetical protein
MPALIGSISAVGKPNPHTVADRTEQRLNRERYDTDSLGHFFVIFATEARCVMTATTITTVTEEAGEVAPRDLDHARKPPLSPIGLLLMNFGFFGIQFSFGLHHLRLDL